MFGYVRIYKPELKIKDYEIYKAAYCSVCRALGRHYGVNARGLLSYDATFLYLYRAAISEVADCKYEKGVCPFNPLKKCGYICGQDKAFEFVASVTVILSYFKLIDSINDSGFFKRSFCRLALPYMKRKYKKAKALYPDLCAVIEKTMNEQAQIENEKTLSTDLAADPSAKALAAIMTYGIQNEEKRLISKRVGYCLGRWVYLTDAYDDITKDLKSHNYNPFIEKYKIESKAFDREPIIKSLRLTANEAALAFNLLDIKCYKEILENIIFDGLENQQKKITEKDKEVSR